MYVGQSGCRSFKPSRSTLRCDLGCDVCQAAGADFEVISLLQAAFSERCFQCCSFSSFAGPSLESPPQS